MALIKRIAREDPFSADIFMDIANDLDGRYSVTDANIAPRLEASKFAWATGYYLSADVFDAALLESGPPSLIAVSNDPMYVRAFGIPYTRMTHSARWPTPAGGGFPFPVRDGWCLPGRTADVVAEVRSSRSGAQDATYDSIVQHAFDSGDAPVHGVCLNGSVAFVACQGSTSAPYPSIKTIALGKGGGVASQWLSLGATYTSVRRICINRHGTYLYVTAKRSGDTNHRRVLRVDISSKAVSECNLSDDNEIHDISVLYDDAAAADSTGTVYIARNKVIAAAGRVEYVAESSTDAYGGSFAATVAGNLGALAGEVYGGCIARGAYAVAYDNGGQPELKLQSFVRSPQEPSGSAVTHNTWNTTLAALGADTIVYGSLFFDGRNVVGMALQDQTWLSADVTSEMAGSSGSWLWGVHGAYPENVLDDDYCGGCSSGRATLTYAVDTAGASASALGP